MEDVRTQAFVLRTRSYGESDVIVVLLSADHGKISGIARGARRSKRRFAGPALEPFQELDVRLARRPHSDLAFLHECRVVTSHHAIATCLDAYAWGSYISELTEVMTPERDPCPEVYDLFSELLTALAGGAHAETTSHRYVMALLDWAGWGPDFSRCSVCSSDLGESCRPIVDPRGSGLMCARHEVDGTSRDPDDPDYIPSRRVVDPDLLAYVRGLRAAPAHAGEAPAGATALLNRLVDLHLQRPFKSRTFLASVLRADAAPLADTDPAPPDPDESPQAG